MEQQSIPITNILLFTLFGVTGIAGANPRRHRGKSDSPRTGNQQKDISHPKNPGETPRMQENMEASTEKT